MGIEQNESKKIQVAASAIQMPRMKNKLSVAKIKETSLATHLKTGGPEPFFFPRVIMYYIHMHIISAVTIG